MTQDLNQGTRITFLHGNEELSGTINGEAMLHDGNLYVPVYVHERDRCLIVHSSNIFPRLPVGGAS